ncbi:MAG: hypothetical protein ABIG96_04360 [Candidatus Micrarchaeota archaeon]
MARKAKSTHWVDEFIDFQMGATESMDFQTFKPFSHLQFHPLFSKEWCDWIEEMIDESAKKGLAAKEAHKLINGACILMTQFFFTSIDVKTAGLPFERRRKIMEWFDSLYRQYRKIKTYDRTKNRVHTQAEVDAIMKEAEFNAGEPETAKLLGKIVNAGYHLTNGIYTDIYMDNAFQYYGPYDSKQIRGNQTFIIKEFNHLKPLMLWPEARSFPANNITIYCVYEDVKFRIDGIASHSIYEGDVVKGLKKWAVKVDGEFVPHANKLIGLYEQLSFRSQEQWIKLISLDFEQLKQKGLEMRCYAFRNLRLKLGLDPGPSEGMKNAVKGKPYADKKYWKIPNGPKKNADYWRKMLDYREEFSPGIKAKLFYKRKAPQKRTSGMKLSRTPAFAVLKNHVFFHRQ